MKHHSEMIRPFSSSSSSFVPPPKSKEFRLPLARPMWSSKQRDLDIAETNSRLRKGSAKPSDFTRIREELLPRQHSLYRTLVELKTELNRISSAFETKAKSQQGKVEISEEERQDRRRGKELREKIIREEAESKKVMNEIYELRLRLPNFTHPKVPIGGEEKAIIIGRGGNSELLDGAMREAFEGMALPLPLEQVPALFEKTSPDASRDHLSIAKEKGWMDIPLARVLSGSSWPLLYGPLALLEHALVRYAMEETCKANFKPVAVPDTVKRDIINRTGFSPRDGSGGQIYWLKEDGADSRTAGEQLDDLAMAATAEIPLAGMCARSRYRLEDLPKQFVAASHAFRAEAGARGQDSRGLYRVHQFTKVEMFVVCRAEDSEEWLEKLRRVQEGIIGGLGVPYRVLDMPTEELGSSAYRKYDIEAWMPGRGRWGEISSASNCTEYQARRLSITYNSKGKERKAAVAGSDGAPGDDLAWAHTLNGTAVAVPRLIVALLENYGVSSNGKIRLPAVLKKHWIENADHEVEWMGTLEKPSNRKTAIEKVRKMAQSSGTDPASMVASFFILHELTAILPLVLIFYLLQATDMGDQVMSWLLEVSDTSGEEERGARAWLREKIKEGAVRAEKYGRRKGYFGFEESTSNDIHTTTESQTELSPASLAGTFANVVAAYAITKALFPLRIGASIALSGPFARLCFEPVKRLIRRRVKSSK
jgi:seryl-tRNA synthetase